MSEFTELFHRYTAHIAANTDPDIQLEAISLWITDLLLTRLARERGVVPPPGGNESLRVFVRDLLERLNEETLEILGDYSESR